MKLPSRPARARRAPQHAPRLPFALLLLSLFGGGMVLLLVLNTASAANEVARHDLAQRDAAVAASVADLRNRVADSAAPGNLAAAAAQLGMVPAGNPAFLVIGADGRVTVMGHPGAASEPPVAQPKPSKTKASKPAATKPAATTPAGPGATTSTTKSTPSTPSATGTSATTTKPARPTSTPTPTLTLPGGDR